MTPALYTQIKDALSAAKAWHYRSDCRNSKFVSEREEWVAHMQKLDAIIDALEQEQAAQEPVAWLWEHIVNGSGAVKDRGLSFTEVEETNNTFWDGAISTKVTRLYAEPPTPPSVHQFADSVINAILKEAAAANYELQFSAYHRTIELIRAEAALQEKP